METVVGITLIIPVILFLLDAAVFVMAHVANDNPPQAAPMRAAAPVRPVTNGASPPPKK